MPACPAIDPTSREPLCIHGGSSSDPVTGVRVTPCAEEQGNAQIKALGERIQLELGDSIRSPMLAYETWGELSPAADNVVLVCHALTGDSHAAAHHRHDRPGWWQGLIGPGRAIDPANDFVVCSNVLGGCAGSTGPTTVDGRFPSLTTRDQVNAQQRLLALLGVRRLRLVIGGSLGAMHVWQWLVDFPDMVDSGVAIAGTPQASPWVVGLNEAARAAIELDHSVDRSLGLAVARMIGMISYRNERHFASRFARAACEPGRTAGLDGTFQVASYLRHHGRSLTQRFDCASYLALIGAMDRHDVARGYGNLDAALARITARLLVVGIPSDRLFFPRDMAGSTRIAQHLGVDATCRWLSSQCGHDAFLIEVKQLSSMITEFRGGRL